MYKSLLSSDEAISLRHLKHYLNRYDKFLVIPEDLDFSDPDFDGIRRFPSAYFESRATYSRLLLSEKFYSAFSDYEYILCYQLDCLVFSDQLGEWCSKGYDYIGAPWFKRPGLGWNYTGPERAGNGGFSLRHVEHSIDAIRRSNQTGLGDVVRAVAELRSGWFHADLKRALLLKRYAATTYPHNEDIWWSYAQNYMSEFRVAPVEVAVKFAFETNPQYCFERNGRQLPFGCHGWNRYQRAFWQQYLLR
jgi:hypothetical protein